MRRLHPPRNAAPAVLRLSAVVLFGMTSAAVAWWPRKSEPTPAPGVVPAAAEHHGGGVPIATLDGDQGKRFVRMADARRDRENELRVFRDVLVEKARETQQLNDELAARFTIDPAEVYTFNPSNRIIFRVVGKPAAVDAADEPSVPPRVGSVAHLQIQEAEDVDLFLRLVKARDLTRTQMSVLLLLVREKELEHKALLERFQIEFGVDPEKHYRFDTTEQTLIERTP